MGIKSKIESWVAGIAINKITVKFAAFLNGKKTAIGALSFLLWVAIYAIPAFTPQYNWIVVYAVKIRDALIASGINLDNELFNTGVGFTLVGLLDKVRKYFKKDDNGNGK